MQKAMLTILAGVLFALLLVYVARTTSPWNEVKLERYLERSEIETGAEFDEFIDSLLARGLIWDVLSVKNLTMFVIIIGLALVNLVAGFHMLIDKMFFRKFFEEPNMFRAYRRGFLAYFAVVAFIVFRFMGGGSALPQLGVLIFVVAFEAFMISWEKRRADVKIA